VNQSVSSPAGVGWSASDRAHGVVSSAGSGSAPAVELQRPRSTATGCSDRGGGTDVQGVFQGVTVTLIRTVSRLAYGSIG
jgi:hypothetical protein